MAGYTNMAFSEGNPMSSKLMEDVRIDPRIKAIMGAMDFRVGKDVENREVLLAKLNTEKAIAAREGMKAFLGKRPASWAEPDDE